mgnify:CR=1 FL=1
MGKRQNRNRNRRNKLKYLFNYNTSKKIGIVGNLSSHGRFGVGKKYMQYFSKFGNVQIINPLDEEIKDLDLLVLPGGADVDTKRYNQSPGLNTQKPDIFFEWFDNFVLPQYVEKNTPIFGICRGMQSGSVFFGCELEQHVENTYSVRSRGELVDYVYPVNLDLIGVEGLDIFPSKRMTKVQIEKLYKVNSLHHQVVDIDPEDRENDIVGLVFNALDNECEAVFNKNYPFFGVQWHPEELRNPQLSNILINHLLTLNS